MPNNLEAAVSEKPLCVDLDGTLARTDLLYESALVLLKKQPYLCLLFPLWLLKGRAYLKREIARRAAPEMSRLPYNSEFLQWLREEHARGRKIVLATASDEILAKKIAEHFGLFSEVIASDAQRNLSGKTKCESLVLRFGEKGFIYAGNSRTDLAVWEKAGAAVVVNARNGLAGEAQKRTELLRQFPPSNTPGRLKTLLRVLRVHQWVKNFLIFTPLMAAHQIRDISKVSESVAAFFSFCFCASAIYVLNDLLDLDADRAHPLKRHRPFASGAMPLTGGFVLFPLLVAAAAICGWRLGQGFFGILGLYLVLSVSYSFFIKRIALADVMCLAGLYTIRIFAGGVATHIPVSNWLLAFAVFFFLSLAMAKRASELFHSRLEKRDSPGGRGYLLGDLEQLSSMGAGAGYISVLVLALYINSPEVKAFYKHPGAIWLVCPLIFYWVSRIWLLTHRGVIREDPLVFALKDKNSYGVGLCVCAILAAATGFQ